MESASDSLMSDIISLSDAITDTAYDLTFSDLNPVQSIATYENEYDHLMSEVVTGGLEAYQAFTDFVQNEYLPFMSVAAGSDYNTIWNQIMGANGDLSNLKTSIDATDYVTEAEEIGIAVGEVLGEFLSQEGSEYRLVVELDKETLAEVMIKLAGTHAEVRDAYQIN
jgi:hypothetical protein